MLIVLAASKERMKATELAQALETTIGFVPQVAAPLIAHGWVQSNPGPTGGYQIIMSLDSISVLEVLEAVEGPVDTGRCVVERRQYALRTACALHAAWSRARDRMVSELARTPLSLVNF